MSSRQVVKPSKHQSLTPTVGGVQKVADRCSEERARIKRKDGEKLVEMYYIRIRVRRSDVVFLICGCGVAGARTDGSYVRALFAFFAASRINRIIE